MKKQWKRLLAYLLVTVLTVGAVSPAAAALDAAYAVGDLIEFGSYPQTKVTDEGLIASLNSEPQTWKSYGYYSGTGIRADGEMTASDFMQFCDVTYDGEKYRGVYFTQYRPTSTDQPATAEYSLQDESGYYTDTVYWFKWEPLTWIVMKPQDGLVMCQTVIDSQPFRSYCWEPIKHYNQSSVGTYWGDPAQTFYANNYEKSDVRAWLTDETDPDSFLNAAFDISEKIWILDTTLNNAADSVLNDPQLPSAPYDSATTVDKIFLGKFEDVGGTPMPAKSSDYAKCQGVSYKRDPSAETYGNTWWRSRMASYYSYSTWVYGLDGWASTGSNDVNTTSDGIRPMMRLDLELATAEHDYTATVTEPTCTEGGYTTHACTHCAGVYTDDYTPALGHVKNEAVPGVVTAPDCVTDGYTTYVCARCGSTYPDDVTSALGHDYGDWIVLEEPTASEEGLETRYCSRCPATETRAVPCTELGYRYFSGGQGTEEDPYRIANAVDLDRIDAFYASHGDALPTNPVYFAQTADIRFYYNSETDNDGTDAYFPFDPWGSEEATLLARPTVVSQMHDAVYDGGGYKIELDVLYNLYEYSLIDSVYAGVFGHVTDSTIRGVTGVLAPDCRIKTTDEYEGYAGFIACAENCLLSDVTVIALEYTQISGEYSNSYTGLLAGRASGSRVEDCFTSAWLQAPDFIGGPSSDYTFRNTWAMGSEWTYSETTPTVTGILYGEVQNSSPKQFLYTENNDSDYVPVDAQGVIQTCPLSYDPDAVGLVYYVYPSERTTIAAGAHGSVIGAGFYRPYNDFSGDPITIAGLQPVPNVGYVFAGWTIENDNPYAYGSREVTLQEDGTYTYSTTAYWGAVTVTANFESKTPGPHNPGDTNGDGNLDLSDVTNLMRYLSGGWDMTIDERNADVNGDGKLTLKDVTLLRRYLAGWDVVLV